MEVVFPSQIGLPGSVSTCIISTGSSPSCASSGTTGPTVNMTGGFTSAYTTTSTAFSI